MKALPYTKRKRTKKASAKRKETKKLNQTRDWSRHKIWCKLHSSRAHSARSSEQSSSSIAIAAGAASAASTATLWTATAAAIAATKRMESIQRIDSGHAMDDAPSSSSASLGGAPKRMAMTTSSSGSSQTSGHSSGTDCSLASMASASAVPAAAGSTSSDQLAALFAAYPQLQLQQPAAAPAATLPLPIDPAAFLAATSTANNPQLYSSLAAALMNAQQQQQQAAAAAVAAAVTAPQPLFPPLLGSLQQLGLSTSFGMPPPPSAFPAAAAFDAANTNALFAVLQQQLALQHNLQALQQSQQQQQQAQQPRFDLGAADPTPMMFATSSAASSTSAPLASAPSSSHSHSSAFAPPPPRASVVTSTFGPTASPFSSAPFGVASSSSGSQSQPKLLFPASSSFGSTGSLHSSSSYPRIATSVPNPFTRDAPSSMQKIVDPKPSMTLPPLGGPRPKAVAARRGGKPAALAAAAALAPGGVAASSGASTSSASSSGGGAKRPSPDRFDGEGSRKRTSPPATVKEELAYRTLDNNEIKEMPLDFDDVLSRLTGRACELAKDVPRKPQPMEDDDDCQVIGEIINRRYKNHLNNVIYNFSISEHMADMRRKGMLMSRHQAAQLRVRYMAEHTIRSLNEYGWAVVDNFLSLESTKNCAKEMETLYHKGLFTAGQLMDNSDDEDFAPPQRNEDDIKNVRSDYIFWYDGVDKRAAEANTLTKLGLTKEDFKQTRLLVSMLDSVVLHFNDRFTGKEVGGRSRAMLAIYPGGSSRYVKHIDNPNQDGRLVTCIYYCNPGWDLEKHGGALRLFPETSDIPIDIDPQADRLVFFWSDRRNPHEVLPVMRHRFAVTIWYMEKNERAACAARKANRRAAIAKALGMKVEELPPDNAGVMRLVARMKPAEREAALRQAQAAYAASTAAHTAASVAASATAHTTAAASVVRAVEAAPRAAQSEQNMARRFGQARSDCTQDEVESEDEDIGDFIPPNTGAMPDYEI